MCSSLRRLWTGFSQSRSFDVVLLVKLSCQYNGVESLGKVKTLHCQKQLYRICCDNGVEKIDVRHLLSLNRAHDSVFGMV
jgi:hypothetical protein